MVIVFAVSTFSLSLAAKKHSAIRNINLAGLIVNAQTLAPVEAAEIYDDSNKLLGATDKNGYYKVVIAYAKTGAIKFSLKIKKKGYQTFSQHENWADFTGGASAAMYFGLRELNSKASSFTDFGDKNNLSYDNVLAGFSKVSAQKEFNDKLAAAKAGNENVLIHIDDKYYVVASSGWIGIKSDKDTIVLNDKTILLANELNSAVKRSSIKWMTPLPPKGEKVAIHTKN